MVMHFHGHQWHHEKRKMACPRVPGQQLNTFEPLHLIGLMCWSCWSKRYSWLPILQRDTEESAPVILESLIARQIWTVTYALGLPHTNAWNWSLSTWCISNAVAQASFKYSSRTAYAAGQNITRPWLLQVAAGDLKPPCSCFRRLQ